MCPIPLHRWQISFPSAVRDSIPGPGVLLRFVIASFSSLIAFSEAARGVFISPWGSFFWSSFTIIAVA